MKGSEGNVNNEVADDHRVVIGWSPGTTQSSKN